MFGFIAFRSQPNFKKLAMLQADVRWKKLNFSEPGKNGDVKLMKLAWNSLLYIFLIVKA